MEGRKPTKTNKHFRYRIETLLLLASNVGKKYKKLSMLENAGNKGRIFHCDFYSSAEMLLNKQFAHLTLLRTAGRIIDSFRGRGVDDGHCED